MKTRIIIYIVLIFLIVTHVIAGDISTTDIMKLISGTWVNSEYRDMGKYGKQIRHDNGTVDYYMEVFDTEPIRIGKIIINGAWIDEEGDVWFKVHTFVGEYFEGASPNNFALYKISSSRNVLEYVWSYHEYPTDLDPDHIFYRIYHRQ